MSHPVSPLRLISLNMLNDRRDWLPRAGLLAQGLSELQPDVVALQEVRWDPSPALWLAERLGDFTAVLCPGTGHRYRREGLAILSRWPVRDHERLVFGRQGRVAQRLIVDRHDTSWLICNVHLHWNPFSDRVRRRQVEHLLAWLPAGQPTVLCGDLNALPQWPSVSALRRRFVWAQDLPNGAEPAPTFPTPLWRGSGLRQRLRRLALWAMGGLLADGCPWQGVLDYVFVDPVVRVIDCRTVLDQPAADNPRLFPSDHRGLCADLAVR